MSVEIVAELSANHLQSLDYAKRIIRQAYGAGADTIKLQTYSPETICADGHPLCRLDDGPWSDTTLRELYREGHTPREWHADLFHEARTLGMKVFSTPFCPDDVDFLESIHCTRYKISSFDIINTPLLERVARTRKPVVISTGMASEREIDAALTHFKPADVTLLHCISEYPARPEHMSLRRLVWLRSDHPVQVGLSDHSLTDTAAIMAVALGAVMIEKHLCLDRSDGGPDAGFSLEPHEFTRLVKNVRVAEAAIATHVPDCTHLHLRPSLWLVRSLEPNELITADAVKVMRPSGGLQPCMITDVIGRRSVGSFHANQPFTEEMIRG